MKWLTWWIAGVAIVACGIAESGAMAMPSPAASASHPLPPLDPQWNLISLKVDIRNLTGPGNAGEITDADMISRLSATNDVWSQCAIRFIPRSVGNVSAAALNIPYSPKSQEDLGKIAAALNPHGFNEALPLTFAGPWNFYDSGSGLFLTGLGWVFVNGSGINRIGAMIDANKIFKPSAGALIAHEVAHALSLPHVAEPNNLMGRNGTNDLTPAQCAQARSFSLSSLAAYLYPKRPESGSITALR